jgi:hypothetical protein
MEAVVGRGPEAKIKLKLDIELDGLIVEDEVSIDDESADEAKGVKLLLVVGTPGRVDTGMISVSLIDDGVCAVDASTDEADAVEV